jgi:hypothetical protein
MKFAAVICAALAAAVIAIPAQGQDPAEVGEGKGWFHTDCSFANRAPDDPIVFPRGPGASHSHDFIGPKVTAFSTNESIRKGLTTCVRTNTPFSTSDRSAYWVPTLYVGDAPVQPLAGVTAGYSAGVRAYRQIEPFPDDLRVIAGDSKGGPTEEGGQRIYLWECPGGILERGTATTAPTCATPRLDLLMRFPDCWNGADDSRDHKSHMAYSRRGACPSTHPVLVPQLQLTVRYPTTGGPDVRLASGDVSTAHADFMNGWDPDKLAGLVARCMNADRYCGGSDYPVPGH